MSSACTHPGLTYTEDYTTMGKSKRSMASWDQIEKAHGLPRNQCVRCKHFTKCERAHLEDHVLGGPDTAENLVPLCRNCHLAMPPFQVGERDRAWGWVLKDGYRYLGGDAYAVDLTDTHQCGFETASASIRGYANMMESWWADYPYTKQALIVGYINGELPPDESLDS